MLGVEELLYVSLGLGLAAGVALSRGSWRRPLRALDALSTASILLLVASMGLIVGSELASMSGADLRLMLAASLAVAAGPGLLGSAVGEAVIRLLEARA